MKAVCVGGLLTSAGKTSFTIGLLTYLSKVGKVSSFKIGPDYIDPLYHMAVIGRRSPSLDGFFMGCEQLRRHFSRWVDGEYVVVEGVMGVLDGIEGIPASTDEVAFCLRIPVLLLVESLPSIETFVRMIEGVTRVMKSELVGIVLTKVKSISLFSMQKKIIESVLGIPVLGYIPYDEAVRMPARHLGLNTDFKDIKKVADRISFYIEENVDVSAIFRNIDIQKKEMLFRKKSRKIAVAHDEAFLFFYPETIAWFEDMGYKVVYFSPLHDVEPPDADRYYIPGGYPEVYKEALSKNEKMLRGIREIAESGVPILAECGGFMYLLKEIDGYPMVGFIDGVSLQSRGLQRFGYEYIKVLGDAFFPRGWQCKGHEFHYSTALLTEKENALLVKKASGGEEFVSGVLKKKVLASYTHFYILSGESLLLF